MQLDPSDVRAWATAEHVPVAARGRLSYDVVIAYLKAHPSVARGVASEHGVPVSTRGAVSLATCEELALIVR